MLLDQLLADRDEKIVQLMMQLILDSDWSILMSRENNTSIDINDNIYLINKIEHLHEYI